MMRMAYVSFISSFRIFRDFFSKLIFLETPETPGINFSTQRWKTVSYPSNCYMMQEKSTL